MLTLKRREILPPARACWVREDRGLRWKVFRGFAAIERLAEDWNRGAHSGTLSPTADAIWMRAFWQAFSDRKDTLVLHALYQGEQLLAVVPVRPCGRWVRAWYSIRNPESPYWMFWMDESRPELGVAVLDHLLEAADYIDFGPLHEHGPLLSALTAAAADLKYRVVIEPRGADAFVSLQGDWEAARTRLSRNQQQQASRKMRQLQQLGNLTYEVVRGGSGFQGLLEECFELETKGWKGVEGAPMKSDPRTYTFYKELALNSAAAGRFALYLLRLDGRLIAFEYCLRAQGKIDMLKLSFDPEYAKYSPGNVLRLMLLQDEADRGEVRSYHMGRPSEWKERWATDIAPLVQLRVYGHRLSSSLAYLGGPVLKQTVKSVPGVQQLRAALRKLGRGR
jgi:CelD/BcsL family acetyltransferase involved in cellulose biosynthesis